MYSICVRNVNGALKNLVNQVNNNPMLFRKVAPRGIETLEFNQPTTTAYQVPTERVLFDPVRDANPFFHMMESLWMLAGRADVAFLSEFTSQMEQYSDDGLSIRGAYGARWRTKVGSGVDQLKEVVNILRRDPDSRRAVVAMWDTWLDWPTRDTKDIPCNTHIYFKLREGKLVMTVCNRSNDAILGAYGANAVHMSILQEYLAAALGVEVGFYYQMSDSLHIYTESPVWKRLRRAETVPADLYGAADEWGDVIRPYPLVQDFQNFNGDLLCFFSSHPTYWAANSNPNESPFKEPFFRHVVIPMLKAWYSRKVGNSYRQWIELIHAFDWRTACSDWCDRRDNTNKEANLGYR